MPPNESIAIVDTFSHRSHVNLIAAVIGDHPEVAPEVAAGATTASEWVWAHEPKWRRAAVDPVGRVIGLVGVGDRTSDTILRHLMVHPREQRTGLGTLLLALAEEHSPDLWAPVAPGSAGHLFLVSQEWAPHEGTTSLVMERPGAQR